MTNARAENAPDANGTGDERDPGEVTQWLIEWTQGEREALDRLIPMVYGELRRLARGYLGRRSPHGSLQPTALINEVFLWVVIAFLFNCHLPLALIRLGQLGNASSVTMQLFAVGSQELVEHL